MWVTDSVYLIEATRGANAYLVRLPGKDILIDSGRPDRQEGWEFQFWPQDCGAAIENLLLQALELGYGSCWCGCYPALERVEKLQKILGVSSLPVAIVAVGVPDEHPDARGYFDPQLVKYL